jgi:acetyltransferase-like isoleucine patch superfamily enzyme
MRELFKQIAGAVAIVLVSPAAAMYWLQSAAVGRQRAFPGWSQAVSLLPGLCGVYVRRAFYRLVLPRCQRGCVVSFGVIFSHPTAELGANVYIGPYGCLGDVTIEDDALIGSHVSITNGSRQHGIARMDVPVREQPGVWPRVTIGRDTWIGDRAIVMASVGTHCVIGAGSVVTRPVPDYAIVIGSPARIIAWRTETGPVPAEAHEDVSNPVDA